MLETFLSIIRESHQDCYMLKLNLREMVITLKQGILLKEHQDIHHQDNILLKVILPQDSIHHQDNILHQDNIHHQDILHKSHPHILDNSHLHIPVKHLTQVKFHHILVKCLHIQVKCLHIQVKHHILVRLHIQVKHHTQDKSLMELVVTEV